MIFGFEINPQTIIATLSPIIVKVVLILVLAMVVQRVIAQSITQVLKIASARERGEDKEEFKQRIETISYVLAATLGFIIWAIAGFTILSELGINVAPILTGAGIVGLAVGFGAQNMVRDMISGLFILIENQYTKGDVVRIAG